jgi:cupin fold WbuC family metalloprotein
MNHFNNLKKIFIVNEDTINKLKINSFNNTKRFRQNLHLTKNSKIQDMIICFKKNSEFGPIKAKKKTVFKLINGEGLVNVYDKKKLLSKNKLNKNNFIIIVNKNTLYKIKATSKFMIINEFIEGPYKQKKIL